MALKVRPSPNSAGLPKHGRGLPDRRGHAGSTVLGQFSSNGETAIKKLQGTHFKELLPWLSASMPVVSHSAPGGTVQQNEPNFRVKRCMDYLIVSKPPPLKAFHHGRTYDGNQ